jgi:L-threonylcarbamoyladenylate synthase
VKELQGNNRLAAVPTLRQGGLVVMMTDTIYGIVTDANNQAACERLYAAKGRDADKACIVLIADPAQIWDRESRDAFNLVATQIGPEPTSIVVPAGEATPKWLPRAADGTIAFRKPADDELIRLLRQSGPLLAPSANTQGELPALNIKEAKHYFGDKVDLYVDGGFAANRPPSRVVRPKADGSLEYLR